MCINDYSYIDGDFSTDIHGLDPYTSYKALVYCKNKAGIGRKDSVNKILFQTDQLRELYYYSK